MSHFPINPAYLSSLRYLAVTNCPRYHCPCKHLNKTSMMTIIISTTYLNTLPASSMPAVLIYTVPSSL